ncbi:unnamed protein product, partial [marine sediment metagenome]
TRLIEPPKVVESKQPRVFSGAVNGYYSRAGWQIG